MGRQGPRIARARLPAEVRPLTSSTPDALWASRSVDTLKPAAVVCEGVSRRQRGQPLLDDLTMVVDVGARLLVVSRPEQSASMLLRILASLSRMQSGIVRLAGVGRPDSSAAGWARRVGYVGPEAGIYPWMTPREVLDLAGRIAEYDPADIQRRIDGVAERYRIGTHLDQPIRRGGEPLAQRVALASAMLTEPEVLLLDEPLRALDPEERARLLTIPGSRRTVVIASRYPASEAGLVDQVAFLSEGRLVIHTPIEELDRRGLALSQRGIDALIEVSAAEAS